MVEFELSMSIYSSWGVLSKIVISSLKLLKKIMSLFLKYINVEFKINCALENGRITIQLVSCNFCYHDSYVHRIYATLK